MNVLPTSCGLETAAISPDAVGVLPKCLNDLRKCGIARENICVCDLHDEVEGELSGAYDVIYLCGGDAKYLLKRVRERGSDRKLLSFVRQGGVVVGVSAGSMIFADDMPENLGLLPCALDVHRMIA